MKDDLESLPADHPARISDPVGDEYFTFNVTPNHPRIPAGDYIMVYESWETVQTQWGPKVAVWLRVLDGPYKGLRLARNYHVERIENPPRKFGPFKPKSETCDLIREWYNVCGKPAIGSAVSLSAYRRMLITARVETVEKDGKGNPLAPGSQYSAIRRLVSGRNADGE